MGLLPDIFGGSKSKSKRPARESYTPSTVKKKNASNDSELMKVMKGKNIDMTDSDVRLSTSRSSQNLSVARSNILGKMSEGVRKTEREAKKIIGSVPRDERKRLDGEIQAAEDDSSRIVKADVSHDEKIIASATVLVEASELIEERVDEMFELKVSIGDRNEEDVRKDMKQVWQDTASLVEQNMPAYDYIHQHAREEEGPIQVYVVNAANLFRNSVKVFSMLNMDAGKEVQRKKQWDSKKVNFTSSGNTLFKRFFT